MRGMVVSGESSRPADATASAAQACYLHGIVPADTSTSGTDSGVILIRHDRIAALTRPLPAPEAPITRRALLGHAEVLDRLAQKTPVLPMRYGTVLASPEAVEREILEPHHDTFAAALAKLRGRAQLTLRARYLPDVALREALIAEPRAARLHRQLAGRTGGSHIGGRVRLGELVARGIAAAREADTAMLVESLRPHAVTAQVQISQSAEPDRIAEAAFLIELRDRNRFEAAAERLARQWHQRIRLRLLGPMAAYHFMGDLVPFGERR